MMTNGQTALELINDTNPPQDVQVWITLNSYSQPTDFIQYVKDIPFVTYPESDLQGWFILPPNGSVSYTPPMGSGISGNFSFETPPLNCPTDQWPGGVNLAEFILNNSFQTGNPQETIDISAVGGVNAFIKFIMSGGGPWNYGQTDKNGNLKYITEFENKILGDNIGQIGVFPFGCTTCTSGPTPGCPGISYGACQTEAICTVQRDASTAGGTVTIIFKGFAPVAT